VKTKAFQENKKWISDKLSEGYTIIDAGDPLRKGSSDFYKMELEVIKGKN
jgi:hypothetical protein